MLTAIMEQAKEWLKFDKPQYEATIEETKKLIESDNVKLLEERYGKRMAFGTAGLRSSMHAGWACMNDLTVIQASQGLVKYAMMHHDRPISVVIGYDGRHNSKRFAIRTAAVFHAQGAKIYSFKTVVPTPFVAFATRLFKCDVGVMITASHNPKQDNGYKVYWGNGAQIIPPHDSGIAQSILDNLTPWDDSWEEISLEEKTTEVYDETFDKYLLQARYFPVFCVVASRETRDLSNLPADVDKNSVKITYTAMHGVGWPFCQAIFKDFNLPEFITVDEQALPDPDFPTVEYPNPEEGKGALELAMKRADAAASTLIFANDPDADRLAIACKHQDQWRVLSGNEIGALLGWWTLDCYKRRHPHADLKNVYMLSSTVSSKILKTMAAAEGFNFDETLSGFKWIGNRALEVVAEGYTVLLGFEEAIGFCIGMNVVDKDGISASAVAAEMSLYLAHQGKTLVDQLDDIHNRYGYHASFNSYFICRDPKIIDEIFAAIRKTYPRSLGDVKVRSIRDVTTGFDNAYPDGKCRLPIQSGHMITFTLENDLVLTLRTSGTEPKIKFYSEIKTSPGSGKEQYKQVDATLRTLVGQVVDDLLQPDKYGLQAKKE